jgi:hypothetical protein
MERYWFYIRYTDDKGRRQKHYDCVVRSSKGYAKRVLEKDCVEMARKLNWTDVILEYHESDTLMINK